MPSVFDELDALDVTRVPTGVPIFPLPTTVRQGDVFSELDALDIVPTKVPSSPLLYRTGTQPTAGEDLGTVEGLWRGLQRGTYSTLAGAQVWGGIEGEDPEDIARYTRELQDPRLAPSKEYQEFQAAEGPWETFKAWIKHPLDITAEVFGEAIPSQVISRVAGGLVGAKVGALAGPKGAAVGAGIGTFAGSFAMEYAAKMLDALAESGVDLTNPIEIARAAQDEELWADIRQRAIRKGVPIAAIDMFSMRVAGKFIGAARGAGVGAVTRAVLKETGTQMALGAAGEAAGEIAAGEKLHWPSIMSEALAEIPGLPGEVYTGRTVRRGLEAETARTAETVQGRLQAVQSMDTLMNDLLSHPTVTEQEVERGLGALLEPLTPDQQAFLKMEFDQRTRGQYGELSGASLHQAIEDTKGAGIEALDTNERALVERYLKQIEAGKKRKRLEGVMNSIRNDPAYTRMSDNAKRIVDEAAGVGIVAEYAKPSPLAILPPEPTIRPAEPYTERLPIAYGPAEEQPAERAPIGYGPGEAASTEPTPIGGTFGIVSGAKEEPTGPRAFGQLARKLQPGGAVITPRTIEEPKATALFNIIADAVGIYTIPRMRTEAGETDIGTVIVFLPVSPENVMRYFTQPPVSTRQSAERVVRRHPSNSVFAIESNDAGASWRLYDEQSPILTRQEAYKIVKNYIDVTPQWKESLPAIREIIIGSEEKEPPLPPSIPGGALGIIPSTGKGVTGEPRAFGQLGRRGEVVPTAEAERPALAVKKGPRGIVNRALNWNRTAMVSSGSTMTLADEVLSAMQFIGDAEHKRVRGEVGRASDAVGFGAGLGEIWGVYNKTLSARAEQWLYGRPTVHEGGNRAQIVDPATGKAIDAPNLFQIFEQAQRLGVDQANFMRYKEAQSELYKYTERRTKRGKEPLPSARKPEELRAIIAEYERATPGIKQVGDTFRAWWNAYMRERSKATPGLATLYSNLTEGFTGEYTTTLLDTITDRIMEELQSRPGGWVQRHLPTMTFAKLKGHEPGAVTINPLQATIKKMLAIEAFTIRQEMLDKWTDMANHPDIAKAIKVRGLQNADLKDRVEAFLPLVKELIGGFETAAIDDNEIRGLLVAFLSPTYQKALAHPYDLRMPVAYVNKSGKYGQLDVPVKLAEAMFNMDRVTLGQIHEMFVTGPGRVWRFGTTAGRASWQMLNMLFKDPTTGFILSKAEVNAVDWWRLWFQSVREMFALKGDYNQWLQVGRQNGVVQSALLGGQIGEAKVMALLDPARKRRLGKIIEKPETWTAWGEFVTRGAEGRAMVVGMVRNGEIDLGLSESARQKAWVKEGQILDSDGKIVGDLYGTLEKMTKEQRNKVFMAMSRVTTNFRDGGWLSQFVTKGVPFSNAQWQGVREPVRTLRNNPHRVVFRALGTITLPTIAAWLAFHDEDWYKELDIMDRLLFNHIKIGDTVVRYPVPFDLGVWFGTGPKLMLDRIVQDDPDEARKIVDALMNVTLPYDSWVDIMFGWATGVIGKEAIQQGMNWDMFWEKAIVPESEQPTHGRTVGTLPEQYGPYTLPLAKGVARIADVVIPREFLGEIGEWFKSPRRVEHMMQGVLGGAWLDYSRDAKTIMEFVSGADVREKEAADIPVAGRLFKRGGVTVGRKSLDILYEDRKVLGEIKGSKEKDLTPEQEQYRRRVGTTLDLVAGIQDRLKDEKTKEGRNKLQIRIRQLARETAATRPALKEFQKIEGAAKVEKQAKHDLDHARDIILGNEVERLRLLRPDDTEEELRARARTRRKYRRLNEYYSPRLQRAAKRKDEAQLNAISEELRALTSSEAQGNESR